MPEPTSLSDILKKDSWLSRLWVSPTGLRSYHSERDKNFNEQNRGIGAEYDLSRNVKLAAGQFDNSLSRQSQYAGAALLGRPFSSLEGLRMGALAGLINGYPEMRKGGLFPMVAPILAYEGDNFGLNILGLPKVGNVSPVIAAQMKFRF